ncbi:MAG: hypothetical protein Q9170_000468, partial [Blastenia crenularia]
RAGAIYALQELLSLRTGRETVPERRSSNPSHSYPSAPSPLIMPQWTCTICYRSMQIKQKKLHLRGKPHAKQAKQSPTNAMDAPAVEADIRLSPPRRSEPSFVHTKGNEEVLSALEIKIRSLSLTEGSPGAGPQGHPSAGLEALDGDTDQVAVSHKAPRHFKVPDSKKMRATLPKATGSTGKKTHSGIALLGQPRLPYISDVQLISFGGGDLSFDFSVNHPFGNDTLNYGLCDKDCGWCGHCMEDVDI